MTENEIIKTLKGAYFLLLQCRVRFEDLNDYREASENAIKALEEVNEYRKIGTVEECKEAVEKAKAMEVTDIHVDEYYCPNCGSENVCDQGIIQDDYCPNCGQKLAPFK